MLLEDIKIKDTVKFHKELSSKIWTESKTLKKEVRTALQNIANAFIEPLEIDKRSIIDIIITGSMCNYNYTKYSDIDLHIVADYSYLCDDCVKFSIADCMDAKRSLWNDKHDITIYGIDVELYIHDMKDKITGNAGVYSIKNNKWLRIPSKDIKINYDNALIIKKAETLMNQIDDTLLSGDTETIAKIQDKIRSMRKSGLEKYGEYSTENLTFKILRNNGYLDKLYTGKLKNIDKELSLK